jgi:hypothetical protein
MRSIAASTAYSQAAGTARSQQRALSSRTLLLIAALVLVVALASLYFGVVAGPLSSHGITTPPAQHLIVCGGTAAPC